jgi:hypothetical protein
LTCFAIKQVDMIKKILIGLIVLFILFTLYTKTMASEKTEKQQYTLVKEENIFEIRYYPAAHFATVYSSAASYRELSSSGFRQLAGYIFGGNETKTQIPMTSPVHMDINSSRSSMSFVMPSHMGNDELPGPNDASVTLEQTEAEYVAAIRFSGYASDSSIKKYAEKLANLLEKEGYSYYGNFRYLGYNPPYQIFGRKNEIIVSVNWPKK